MSRFTLLSEREIDKAHFDRANEILNVFADRNDAGWEDLSAMIAEALQITENAALGLTNTPRPYAGLRHKTDDKVPDVEVVSD